MSTYAMSGSGDYSYAMNEYSIHTRMAHCNVKQFTNTNKSYLYLLLSICTITHSLLIVEIPIL